MSGRILAVCIGSCAPVLLYLLAAKIFNRKTAILAAILYVFFPTHIGYSHCLWSEIFFGVLLLLSTLFFFLFLEDTTKKKYFLLCFVTTGLTLLTKEFAVVIFGAFFLILIFSRLDNKFKKLVLATVLFMVPAVIYSVTASCLTKKIIVLNDAIIINFQAGAGNWGDYSYESREEDVGNLLDALKQRGVKNTVKNSIRQASSLWAPKSFISTRVASRPVPGWDYGIENPKPLVYLISGYYVFLVLTAIPGICLGKNDTFKFFSIACLSLLTATSVLALLVSRYRLPFMFVVIMYSAHFMTQGVSLFSREKRLFPLAWVLLLIMLFIDIVISTIPVLDQWG
jgi:4-amino-4-deoxy-L-arabinose transferase-like glycosyltransferase